MSDWDLSNFASFWTLIEIETIMALFDKPLPSLILYSSDLMEVEEVEARPCSMCKGTGIIDHVYPSGCGTIIHEDITCPLCQGRG